MEHKYFEQNENKTQLVFDFGGGTLDVALVRVGHYKLEILAIDGDNYLGGQDLDHALMNYFLDAYIEEYKVGHNGKEPKITDKIRAKFKQAACRLKIDLSGDEEADFVVYTPDFFVDGFTREEFESICNSVLEKILEPVKRVLTKAGMSKDEI